MATKISEPALAAERSLAVPPRTARAIAALYYRLTKPGIVYSNVMTAAAGFLFAAHWHANLLLMLALLGGNALIIASACVANNYIDRGIDRVMLRTRTRALASGAIAVRRAIAYAGILGIIGFGLLGLTNPLTVAIGALAWLSYVALYGYAKRHTPHGTLIGTLPGGASLVAGYTAVTGQLDMAAAALFLIMLVWQMAHFYSIAIFRLNDYRAAGLPVWPARYGVRSTMQFILAYVVGFGAANVLLVLAGFEGTAYLLVMTGLSIYWLWGGLRGFNAADTTKWARGMFGRSLIVLLVFAVALPLGALLQ